MKSIINLIKNQWTYHTKTKRAKPEPRAVVNEGDHKVRKSVKVNPEVDALKAMIMHHRNYHLEIGTDADYIPPIKLTHQQWYLLSTDPEIVRNSSTGVFGTYRLYGVIIKVGKC